MAADINIVIGAQDTATAVINKTAANADQQLKRIQTNARSGKASIDLFGTLAKSLGATGLGAYSSEVAQVTDKLNGLASAGAGVKIGLAGIAAVAGFKIGTEIGNWVFETEKFKAMLQEANVELTKAGDLAARIASTKLSIETEKIELIQDPAEQDKAFRARYTALSREAEQQARIVEQIKERQAAEVTWAQSWLGQHEEVKAANAAEVAAAEKIIATIEAEQAKIEQKLSSGARELEQIREKNALQKQAESNLAALEKELELLRAKDDLEKAGIEAKQRANGDPAIQARIEQLLREKQQIEANQAAEKEAEAQRKKDADQAIRDAERIATEKKREDERIAKAFANVQPGTQATESRLLTRGPAEKGIDKIAKHTEETAKVLKDRLPLSTSPSAKTQTELVVVT